MNRTIERIVFTIIGALIAFFAYLVGNIDGWDVEAQNPPNHINANTIDANIIRCKMLKIEDGVYIGGKDKGMITLNAFRDSAYIILYSNIPDNETIGKITIAAETEEITGINVSSNKGKDAGIAVNSDNVGLISVKADKRSAFHIEDKNGVRAISSR